MEIRPEAAGDAAAIRAVNLAAFPSADEADIVERLRALDDAVFSLVCVGDDRIAGHMMLSRLQAPFRALALAPLAVLPDVQRRGLGGRLIAHGVALARRQGWEAIFVLGDPAYYQRHVFSARHAQGFASPYAGRHFMGLPLSPGGLPVSEGALRHSAAFDP